MSAPRCSCPAAQPPPGHHLLSTQGQPQPLREGGPLCSEDTKAISALDVPRSGNGILRGCRCSARAGGVHRALCSWVIPGQASPEPGTWTGTQLFQGQGSSGRTPHSSRGQRRGRASRHGGREGEQVPQGQPYTGSTEGSAGWRNRVCKGQRHTGQGKVGLCLQLK